MTLAGPFYNVRIYMTERVIRASHRSYRWTDTQLVGTLKVIVQSEVNGIPLALMRVYGGEQGEELIFEYEVPMNFVHDCELADETLYCIQCGINDQYFGFKMLDATDKTILVKKMKQLANLLRKNRRQLREMRSANPSDLTIDHIEMPDQLEEIFGSQNYEQKLSDLYDMLIEQGLDQKVIGTVFEKLAYSDSEGGASGR